MFSDQSFTSFDLIYSFLSLLGARQHLCVIVLCEAVLVVVVVVGGCLWVGGGCWQESGKVFG